MSEPEDQLKGALTNRNWEKVEDVWIALSDQEPERVDLYRRTLQALIDREQENRVHDMATLMARTWDERGRSQDVYTLLEPLVKNDLLPGELEEIFQSAVRGTFSSHSALDLCFQKSELNRNVNSENFETFLELVQFDEGSYVYHSSGWGTGKIQEVEEIMEVLLVDFENRPGHEMKIEAAHQYLNVLPEDDPRALDYRGREELEEALEERPVQIVAAYLKTRDAKISLKELRGLLKDKVFSDSQWTRWWNKVRSELLQHPNIEVEGRTSPDLSYREQSKKPEQELLEKISFADDPENVRRAIQNYMSFLKDNPEAKEQVQDALESKFEYFIDQARDRRHRASFIELVLFLNRKMNFLEDDDLQKYIEPVLLPGEEFQEQVDEIAEVLNRLQSKTDYSEVFSILEEITGQEESYLLESELLLHVRGAVWKHLARRLIDRGAVEYISDALYKLTGVPGKYPLAYVSMVGARTDDELEPIQQFIPSEVEIFRNLVEISETTSERYLPESYTVRKMVSRVEEVMKQNDWEIVREAAPLLDEEATREMREKVKRMQDFRDTTRAEILSTLKDVEEEEEEEGYFWESRLIFSTREGIEKREEQYNEIISEKLPENQKAVEKAREMGDVSENAELDAALEERSFLTSRARKMKEELDRARSFSEVTLEEGLVQPGTRVTVTDEDTGEEQTYTILGPWDSDAAENVISYKTPLAGGLLGEETGNTTTVELPEEEKTFHIESVEKMI